MRCLPQAADDNSKEGEKELDTAICEMKPTAEILMEISSRVAGQAVSECISTSGTG